MVLPWQSSPSLWGCWWRSSPMAAGVWRRTPNVKARDGYCKTGPRCGVLARPSGRASLMHLEGVPNGRANAPKFSNTLYPLLEFATTNHKLTKGATMKLNPCITFNGQCEAAFKFYEQCLGGRIQTMMTWGTSPMADIVPSE